LLFLYEIILASTIQQASFLAAQFSERQPVVMLWSYVM